MNYFNSDITNTSSSSLNNKQKALVSLQQINNNLSRKRLSQDLTSTLTNNNNNSNRPLSITSEYLADKLNSIRTQTQQQQQQLAPLRIKKSRSNLYSSSSSSLYRQPLLPNSYLSNPSPRVRLRNLAFRAQPYRSFFTRLSTVFEEEDHPTNCHTSHGISNSTITNNDFNKQKLSTNSSKSQLLTSNTYTTNYTFNNNNNFTNYNTNNKSNRLVSHKLNGSIGKKFKPTAYYSSFENEKNDIDYESFLYTDPSLNTSNSNNNNKLNNELNQIEFNNINSNKRSSFTPLNLKPDFATDKNILNEFNLLLLDELKRIKSRNQQQTNETENSTKTKSATTNLSSTLPVKYEEDKHQPLIESILPSKQSKIIQTNLSSLPKKQSVYTSTENDEANTNESQPVYKIMNSSPPIPPSLNKKHQPTQTIKIASPSQLKIKPGDPSASSLSFSLNDAPKVRVISRGNGEGQMPPRPNKVSSPPASINPDRNSPKSVSKPVYPDVYISKHTPLSTSPKTISSNLPSKSSNASLNQIKSPTNDKFSNDLAMNKIVPQQPQQQYQKDLFQNYSDSLQNLMRKDSNSSLATSQSSSSLSSANSALSNYYNKLYSTDLRPEAYNYEDYLYKPSNYYDDNNPNKLYNKLTDSFSSLLSLKNLNSSPSPLSNLSNSPLPVTYNLNNNMPTLSRQEPYHVASIPVVYVNSSNRNDKIIINPAASQPLPIYLPKPNRIINIEDIKREIEKEAEEITENKLSQKQQQQQNQQQQLIEQIKQEVVAAAANTISTSPVNQPQVQHVVSPIQEEEEPDEVEQEEAVNEDDDETTEEILSEKSSSEETSSSSEEVENISEETTTATTTMSEENTNTIEDTTVDDITNEEIQHNLNTQIKSPMNLIKLLSPTLDKPITPPQSTTPILENNDLDLLKEEQESELVNMIKDIKSTLESCCLKEEQLIKKEQEEISCLNSNNIQSNNNSVATPTKIIKTNIRNLPVYHSKLINGNLNNENDNSINPVMLNTSQEEFEENEIFEVVF